MHARVPAGRSTILLIAALMPIMAGAAAALPQGSLNSSGARTITRGELLFHGFMGEDMQDAYGSAYGLQASILGWFEALERIGLRGDLAIYGAENGVAKIIDGSWAVTKRKLGVLTLEASITALYRLREPDTSRKIMPYTGIGIGGVFGFDQLWASINRLGTTIEGHTAGAFRPAFESHILVGTTIPISSRFSLVTEALWIQAGNAALKKMSSPATEEDKARDDVVHSVLRYPDMNITGWRLLAGAQYEW